MFISVVIIAKNEAHNIAACIKSANLISNDVLVIDSGSDDNTTEIARSEHATVKTIEWKGYGDARNSGASEATHDWVFALDADERITKQLADAILQLNGTHAKVIYGCRRKNYFGKKVVNFGEWGSDTIYRLYNKNDTKWDDAMVHESLISNDCEKKLLPGFIEHYTIQNMEEFRVKLEQYAQLQAQNFYERGKKAGFFKRFFSPAVNFLGGYIFRLGFLDGATGLQVAKMNAHYTWLKYNILHKLNRENN